MRDYLIIQISDVHLTTSGTLPPGVRPRDNLAAGLSLIAEAGLRPDVLLLTGDLADAGDAECYEDLAAIIDYAARPSSTTVVYLPGNHDVRSTFRRHLLGQEADAETINQVHWRDGLRLIALDSVIVNNDAGALTDESLDFLSAALATPAPDGSILALHHPPIPSPIEPMSRLMLREPQRLADAIEGSDVRLVVCGHNHHAGLGMLGSTPVWVSPSTAYRADTTSRSLFRRLPGAALSQIELRGSSVIATTVPIAVPSWTKI